MRWRGLAFRLEVLEWFAMLIRFAKSAQLRPGGRLEMVRHLPFPLNSARVKGATGMCVSTGRALLESAAAAAKPSSLEFTCSLSAPTPRAVCPADTDRMRYWECTWAVERAFSCNRA